MQVCAPTAHCQYLVAPSSAQEPLGHCCEEIAAACTSAGSPKHTRHGPACPSAWRRQRAATRLLECNATSGRMEDSSDHRGRILRLEVNSFKSYRGHNVIGPFKCGGGRGVSQRVLAQPGTQGASICNSLHFRHI